MEYLIRFAQSHESFRQAELEALSRLANLRCEILSYRADSPFCIVRFPALAPNENQVEHVDETIRCFESRAILSKGIYELWGQGGTYDGLHNDVRKRSAHLWEGFRTSSFKFNVDCYGSTRDATQQRGLIDSFKYVGFQGKIRMKNPDAEFTIFEEWLPLEPGASLESQETIDGVDPVAGAKLNRVFLTRRLGGSRRHLKDKHDLKKRPYISTTSMDAELALITTTLALAAPGKLFLDPFVGTGGFMVAASELGAVTLGSDIDGRSYKGKGAGVERGVGANFKKYGLQHLFGDCVTSDLTNTPFRRTTCPQQGQHKRWLDGIVSDPPYGVREGLKVLGTRRNLLPPSNASGDGSAAQGIGTPVHLIGGVPGHTLPGYIAPKKPYSFVRMLNDILEFAARTLVDGGRIAFWMPSANENEFGEEGPTIIPTHSLLELKHECVQRFNKWSRRLLVYERLPGELEAVALPLAGDLVDLGHTADDLNPFRKRYFQPVVDKNGGNIS